MKIYGDSSFFYLQHSLRSSALKKYMASNVIMFTMWIVSKLLSIFRQCTKLLKKVILDEQFCQNKMIP